MRKILATAVLILAAAQAHAEPCPDYYRFVEFGVTGNDGILRRGGTPFRVVGTTGSHLLHTDQTRCRAVPEVFLDGHLHPIPVVARIDYRPEALPEGVGSLRLSAVEDAEEVAEQSAARHRAALARQTDPLARGERFLCAGDTDSLSCQTVSPYGDNSALVAYCDAARCEVPGLRVDTTISASATWARTAATPEATGQEIGDRVRRIHAFLADPG